MDDKDNIRIMEKFEITEVSDGGDLSEVKALFLEYARSLDFNLCFQSFERELVELPGAYAPPEGRLLIARHNGMTVGCTALHKIDDETCEMKRLYVRPATRGMNLGRMLAEAVIREARKIGYHRMRLDTITSMTAAIELYRSLGFYEIEPYRPNPIPGALYMELILDRLG